MKSISIMPRGIFDKRIMTSKRDMSEYRTCRDSYYCISCCKRGLINMNENKSGKTICKSVFKNGKNTTTKSRFTKKWIELINRLEKNKSAKI